MTSEVIKTPEETLWAARWAALYKADVSARYHRRRQRFFDLADKLTKALTVLLGATLMGSMLKDSQPVAASVISSLSLLALVFAYSDRKQAHKELAEGFINLIQQIEACSVSDLTEAKAAAWMAMATAMDAKEPPCVNMMPLRRQDIRSTSPGRGGTVGWLLISFEHRTLRYQCGYKAE
jgi:hypothetical protein